MHTTYTLLSFLVITFKKEKEIGEINFNNLFKPVKPKYYLKI